MFNPLNKWLLSSMMALSLGIASIAYASTPTNTTLANGVDCAVVLPQLLKNAVTESDFRTLADCQQVMTLKGYQMDLIGLCYPSDGSAPACQVALTEKNLQLNPTLPSGVQQTPPSIKVQPLPSTIKDLTKPSDSGSGIKWF